MKKILVLALCGLAACGTVGRRDRMPPAVYDLGQAPVRLTESAGAPPLALETRIAVWFDSPGIKYRLAYAEGERLQEYVQARWAASPALLLQQRLAQRLGLISAGQGGAACLLRIDVDEFSQIFDTPQSSRGVLQARLSLLDRTRNQLLAEQAVKIEKQAPSQDSRGGVLALATAVEALSGEVGGWRDSLAASGRLKGCEKKGF